jgi:hypothetical protein
MNRLLIATFKNGEGEVVYKVYESGTGTVYMVTRNKEIAEELVVVLKSEYQQERRDAS